MHDDNPKLQAALAYAALGYEVFPLQPGLKTPYPDFSWTMEASSRPLVITGWWHQWPDANVAIACGQRSGITVLDFDCKDDAPGMALAADLLGPSWTDTLEHNRTPSRGAHLVIPYSEALGNRKRKRMGLDIQGDGSYIVAPPSVLSGSGKDASGPYVRVVGGLLDATALAAVERDLLGRLGQDQGAKVKGDQRLPEDWKHEQYEPPVWLEMRLPPKVRGFWFDGDLSAYASRSEAIYGVAIALHALKLPPQTVLQAMMDNTWCFDTATADGRRPEGGDSAAQWLWAYAVMPTTPLNPFALADGHQQVYHTEVPQLAPQTNYGPAEAQPQQRTQAGEGPAPTEMAETPPEVDPFKSALDYVSRLMPGQYDKVNEALANLAVMALMPHEEDIVLDALAQAVGMKLVPLRNTLKRVRQGHDGELEKARREAAQGTGLAARYVYIARQDRVWDTVEQVPLTPTAFGNMYGSDARERFINDGVMPRVTQLTYYPCNQFSELFSENDRGEGGWMFPRDQHTGETRLNTWAPVRGLSPKLDATAADIKPWLLHLRDGLRLPEEERLHLLAYMAHLCQFPGEKINHMIVLGGNQGSGKGFAMQPLYEVLGSENIKNVRQNVLDSTFDPDVQHAKVMEIEELANADWDRSRASMVYNNLKPYGAAPPARLSIVLKNMNAIDVPNIVQVIAQTNHRNAVVLEQGDRRCAMLWANGMLMPPTVAASMWAWMDTPQSALEGHTGAQAVAGFLLRYDVSGFDPKAPPPLTEWKEEVMESSLTDVAQAVAEVKWRIESDVIEVTDLLGVVQGHMMNSSKYDMRKAVTVKRLVNALDQLAIPHRRVNLPSEGSNARGKVRLVALRNSEQLAGKDPRTWYLLS